MGNKPSSVTGDVGQLNFIEKDEALSIMLGNQEDKNENEWTTVRSRTPKRNKNYNRSNTVLVPEILHARKNVDLNHKSSDQPHYSSKKTTILQPSRNNDLNKKPLDQPDRSLMNEKANVVYNSQSNNISKNLLARPEDSVIIEGSITIQNPQNVDLKEKSSHQADDSIIDQNEVTQTSLVTHIDFSENKAGSVAQSNFSEKDDEVFARLLQQQEDELAVANFANQSNSLDDQWEEVQHKKRRSKKA